NLPPGPATIHVQGGGASFEQNITVPPGQGLARLYHEDNRMMYFGGAALALGAVGVAAGAAGGEAPLMGVGAAAGVIGLVVILYDVNRQHDGVMIFDSSGRV